MSTRQTKRRDAPTSCSMITERRPYPIVGSPWYAIDLPRGRVALIDGADLALINGASLAIRSTPGRRQEYVFVGQSSSGHYLHRILLGICGVDQRTVADHINRDGLDNRRINLRIATKSQNGANAVRRSGASAFKGVWRLGNRWVAAIKATHIGVFATEEEAARAYDREAFALWGDFALPNFPRNAEGA